MQTHADVPVNKRGWEHTATNILGDKRKGMMQNLLHQKPTLGKSGTHCLMIPHSSFTYGMKTEKASGVAEALCWQSCDANRLESSQKMVPDFVALNCESLKCGITTCKELPHFRATHNICRSETVHVKRKLGIPKRKLDIVHGITNRVCTPMAELLANHYQNLWIEAQMRKATQRQQKKVKLGTPKETKTSLLRATSLKPTEELVWKPRTVDLKIVGGLDTFREERCREMAYRACDTERPIRMGMFGMGICRTGEIG